MIHIKGGKFIQELETVYLHEKGRSSGKKHGGALIRAGALITANTVLCLGG